MRIGIVYDPDGSAATYRAIVPGEALARRGHDLAWPPDRLGGPDYDTLASCDVALVYRWFTPAMLTMVRRLARRGVPIVYDIDDDYSLVPDDHPEIISYRKAMKAHPFAGTLQMAKLAAVMTTTSEPIAEHYRNEGVQRVRVIPNALNPTAITPPQPHDGFVVGWIGGLEHASDVAAVGLVPALERLLADHPDVRVEAVGVDLRLTRRYRHHGLVHFDRLGDLLRTWDVGIAPIADTPFNRARSAIKLQEYAARGVPWLASPVGPYADLGEPDGGRLVEDGDWYAALNRLVRKRKEHARLREAARDWAATWTIARTVLAWEAGFAEAVSHELARRAPR